MKRLVFLFALFLFVPSAVCGQETPEPEMPEVADPAPPTPAPKQAPAKPATPEAKPPRLYQPEGPDPTQILAHEHSVTDMLDVVPFTSKIFHNTRMLRVFLPGNYFSPHNRARKYPVLYLQDGQNVFDKATSFGGKEWE